MTDHSMKAEVGAFTVTGGEVEIKINVPLPGDHPTQAFVGQIAAKWSLIENFIDRMIWILAKTDEKTGACITGQIGSSMSRLTAVQALCIHRGLDASILKQVRKLGQDTRNCQNRRNRILHDPWYLDVDEDDVVQFKSMARDEWLFGFHPITDDFLKETLALMDKNLEATGKLLGVIASQKL